MKLFIYHVPTCQAFFITMSQGNAEEVEGLPSSEIQKVGFVQREITRRFGEMPHVLDIQITPCVLMGNGNPNMVAQS
jgi:hypothetical protein